jgi:hypothetical protein
MIVTKEIWSLFKSILSNKLSQHKSLKCVHVINGRLYATDSFRAVSILAPDCLDGVYSVTTTPKGKDGVEVIFTPEESSLLGSLISIMDYSELKEDRKIGAYYVARKLEVYYYSSNGIGPMLFNLFSSGMPCMNVEYLQDLPYGKYTAEWHSQKLYLKGSTAGLEYVQMVISLKSIRG